MTQERSAEPRALENSEAEFMARYGEYAASGLLYPQPEGSPLLEFAAGGRVLYLFDRCGPYAAPPGPARVVVNGLLDLPATEVLGQDAPQGETLTLVGISAAEGCGQIEQVLGRSWVVRARLPLVLSAYSVLPAARPGDWVRFRTLPPLHGFVLTG